MAVEALEAWVLALLGETRSERHADAKAVLEAKHGIKGREALAAVFASADLSALPADASSLRR